MGPWAAIWGPVWGEVWGGDSAPPEPQQEETPFVAADDGPAIEDTFSDDDMFYIAAALITSGVLQQCH